MGDERRLQVNLFVRDLEYLRRIASEQRPMNEDDMLSRNRVVHLLGLVADAGGYTQ